MDKKQSTYTLKKTDQTLQKFTIYNLNKRQDIEVPFSILHDILKQHAIINTGFMNVTSSTTASADYIKPKNKC
jgi:hypothetical protein